MSYHKRTTHTEFEQQFAIRLVPIDAALSIWSVKAFPGKGDLARDEAQQHVRISLWAEYTNDPAGWEAKPPQQWMGFAKTCYQWFILHEKVVERHTDYAEDLVRDDFDQTGDEALSNKLRVQQRCSRYPREILLTEDRIDLERAIQRGFALLPERYHADMRQVMVNVMEGYNQREIQDKHGWTNNHARVLFRHLRTTFYETLTGHKRERCAYMGGKAPATDDELRQLRELRAQGLSFVKIGARLGFSQGWVMQNLRRLHDHRPTFTERERARNKRIAEVQALVDQGMSYREIARTMNTSYNTIRRLLGKC